MVRNFFIETPFSSSNLTKSMRSCSRACIMASSRAPCGHSWPYTNISVRAISTRFQVRARLSCSGGLRCCDLKSAVKMVWSSSWVSPSGFSWIRYTVIYSAITLTTYIYILTDLIDLPDFCYECTAATPDTGTQPDQSSPRMSFVLC